MDKLIVYVDDAAHALGVIQPLLGHAPGEPPRQWILVACAPRVTHHVSKWVTHSARESWRGRWADKLFAQLLPALEGEEVLTCCGKGNLATQTEGLQRLHGAARVIDARRPKVSAAATAPLVRPSPRPGLLSACLTMLGSGLLVGLD